MNRHMVEQAGSRFFELASSFSRMHADTLSGLADATSKTPFGPVFAVNASIARMATDGIETLASRMNAETDVTTKQAEAPAPVAPAPVKVAPPAPVQAKAPAPKPAKAPAAPKAVKAITPKQAEPVHTPPVAAFAEAFEPDIADVLVDDVLAGVTSDLIALTDKDDLTRINGIGATTAKKLNGIGIESFAQIAEMTEPQFADLLASLDIKTIRFSPAVWIAESKTLSTASA